MFMQVLLRRPLGGSGGSKIEALGLHGKEILITMPPPDSCGPIPWSEARPWSVWAFVVVYLVTAVYWTIFISEGRANSLGWVAGLLGVYFLWRGSKLAIY